MTDQTPRTKAGRAAWAKADGLGPKIDTLTVTAREWRETILAIEREAAFRKPRFRFEDRDRLFDEIDKRFGRNVARFVDDRLASPERPEADDD